jgi:CDP-diacylglycerol--glycerol-3-phosphate 3-phosphatidyltransferase/cardiolipin synthase
LIANAITSVRLLLLVPLYLLTVSASPGMRWAALGVFLLAGATDVLDGFVARKLGQTSRAGALLDLAADRLLTLTSVFALMAAGTLHGAWLVAGIVLVARDMVVATLNEALPGQLNTRATPVERLKIALQFIGLALLIAPPVSLAAVAESHVSGRWCLTLAAAFAGGTTLAYCRRAASALRIRATG